jgi:hypothetical protein
MKINFSTSHPTGEMQPLFLATFSKYMQYLILYKTSNITILATGYSLTSFVMLAADNTILLV